MRLQSAGARVIPVPPRHTPGGTGVPRPPGRTLADALSSGLRCSGERRDQWRGGETGDHRAGAGRSRQGEGRGSGGACAHLAESDDDPVVVAQHALQRFLWYELTHKWIARPDELREVAEALAAFFDEVGALRDAAVCRSPETERMIATEGDGWVELVEASGLEPPDTVLLEWGALMGIDEAQLRHEAAVFLEGVIERGELVPSGVSRPAEPGGRGGRGGGVARHRVGAPVRAPSRPDAACDQELAARLAGPVPVPEFLEDAARFADILPRLLVGYVAGALAPFDGVAGDPGQQPTLTESGRVVAIEILRARATGP